MAIGTGIVQRDKTTGGGGEREREGREREREGREREREGREREREGGRLGGREGEREGGREGGRIYTTVTITCIFFQSGGREKKRTYIGLIPHPLSLAWTSAPFLSRNSTAATRL